MACGVQHPALLAGDGGVAGSYGAVVTTLAEGSGWDGRRGPAVDADAQLRAVPEVRFNTPAMRQSDARATGLGGRVSRALQARSIRSTQLGVAGVDLPGTRRSVIRKPAGEPGGRGGRS